MPDLLMLGLLIVPKDDAAILGSITRFAPVTLAEGPVHA